MAYVRAVAATARINVYRAEVDEDSIDLGFAVKSVAGKANSPKLDAQLKCVSELEGNETHFRFPLKIKNYNELVGEHFVPKILIVVLIPPAIDDWLAQSPAFMSVHRCGYWVSLREFDRSDNQSSVTVSIPRDAIFSPSTLRGLLPLPEAL